MIEPFYDDLSPVIDSIAAEYARRYSQYGLDREDLSQSAWLWLYEHPRKCAEFFENGTEQGVKLIARTLRNELHDVGEDAKAQHLGYSRDDIVYYTKAYVKSLLPSMFDEEAWLHPEQGDGERRAPSDPATGGNWITTLADISRAYDRLSKEDRDLLAAFHRDEYSNKLLSEMFDISEQTMSYRHDRAIGRLVKHLGGPKPRPQHGSDPDTGQSFYCEHGWGSTRRRAQSNAAARAYQQGLYDE